MWRCCGQVVIVSFHSSFVSFGLEKNERKTKHDPASFFVPQECGNEMAGQFTPGISFPHFLAHKNEPGSGFANVTPEQKSTYLNRFNFAHKTNIKL